MIRRVRNAAATTTFAVAPVADKFTILGALEEPDRLIHDNPSQWVVENCFDSDDDDDQWELVIQGYAPPPGRSSAVDGVATESDGNCPLLMAAVDERLQGDR